MKIIFLYIILLSFLASCSGFNDAAKVLRNEKKKSTDEFLVKKRDPLILPPDYKNVPKPDTLENSKYEKKNKLKKMLKVPSKTNTNNTKASSIEDKILRNIKK
jgi:hypothetical protein